jgi:hypothetical protein
MNTEGSMTEKVNWLKNIFLYTKFFLKHNLMLCWSKYYNITEINERNLKDLYEKINIGK